MTDVEHVGEVPVRMGRHKAAAGGLLRVTVVGEHIELAAESDHGRRHELLYVTPVVAARLAVMLLTASEHHTGR